MTIHGKKRKVNTGAKKKAFHGSRKGSPLAAGATKDAWKRKGQAKGQG